jgi:DNA-binding NtrC family response regulator
MPSARDVAAAEPTGRAKVLVVDDEAAALTSAEAVLSSEFDVFLAGSAQEAERLIASASVDVVLTDHQMPKCSGLELLERIKVADPRIVGILLTGHAQLPEVRRARSARLVFHVLIKPVSPENLITWTRTAARSARLRQAVDGLKRHLAGAGGK